MPLRGRRILLVEDETLVGLDVAAMIGAAGGTAVGPFARTGEALAAMSRSRIDAAVVDLNLSGDRSTAVLDALDRAFIPFVICSGYGAVSLPAAFASRRFVAKPFRVRELLEALQQILPSKAPAPVDGLRDVLQGTLSAMDADKGNIQVLKTDVLSIAVQQGFDRPFLQFFAEVAMNDGQSACGRALRTARRVVFEDVQTDPAFAGTDFRTVLLDAEVRSVCSTPIVAAGKLRGMLSIHRPVPWRPHADELDAIDRFARDAAAVLAA